MPVASVIIPAYNAGGTLAECLMALEREGVPGPDVDLIVVDDRSDDGTASIARGRQLCTLAGAGRGPAAARNLGAREARGEVLVFLDADTAPEPGWLAALLAPFDDPGVVAVKGAYHSAQRSLVARFSQLEFESKYARLARARRVDFVDTGTAAFRRQAFFDAGGFDESFPANSAEDVELAFRLSAGGARLAFQPAARVQHRHPERLRDYLTKKMRYGYFRTAVYGRHPSKALGDSYTPPLMGVQICLAGLLAGLSIASLVNRAAARRLPVVLALFGGTTLPLARRAASDDPVLAAAAPSLVLARSFAQGLGIAAGLMAGLGKRLRATVAP
ncbi:MAG: glycosyltransferase [Chloroflexi bacterium]|nr:glycosyltransferase [Chloroflexota bacterium]